MVYHSIDFFGHSKNIRSYKTFWMVVSAYYPTIVELKVELIGELFIVELFYCNYCRLGHLPTSISFTS